MPRSEEIRREISKLLLRAEQLLARMPKPFSADVRPITEIRKLLVEFRKPRVVIAGDARAQKSELLSSIFKAHEPETKRIDLEHMSDEDFSELGASPPDLLLYVVPQEISGEDVRSLGAIVREVERKGRKRLPVFAIAQQSEQKSDAHGALEREIDQKLRADSDLRAALSGVFVGVHPQELGERMFRELPDEARIEFARATQLRNIQDELSDKITMLAASMSAAIAITPLPLADIAPLTSLQAALVAGVAWISGKELSRELALEYASALAINAGAAVTFRETARALIKAAFPGLGSVVSAAVAFGGTVAIGQAARSYFLRDSTSVDA